MEKIYIFEKPDVNISQLETEIAASPTILTGVVSVILRGTQLYVTMKDELPTAENDALAQLVSNHVAKFVPDQRLVMASIVENEKYASLGIELSYRLKPFLFDIPAGVAEHAFEISFKYPIILLGGTVDIHPDMIGDSMRYCTLAPTPIGQLAFEATESSDEIYVVKDQGEHCFKGMDVLINNEHVGRIISINRGIETDKLVLDSNLTQAYAVGSILSIAYTTVEKYLVTAAPIVLWVSRDTDRGAIVNANQKMRFTYWNTNGLAKKVQFATEYYS